MSMAVKSGPGLSEPALALRGGLGPRPGAEGQYQPVDEAGCQVVQQEEGPGRRIGVDLRARAAEGPDDAPGDVLGALDGAAPAVRPAQSVLRDVAKLGRRPDRADGRDPD